MVFASLATSGASLQAFSFKHSEAKYTSITSLRANKSNGVDDGLLSSRRRFGQLSTVALVLIASAGDKANAVIDKFQSDQRRETANFRETYLTEPTEEFKQNEEKALAFKKGQLQIKQKFVDVLTRFTNESKTESDIVKDLGELRELVIATGGLPIGIKKEQIYKIIRAKKRVSWSTPSEIAYQELIRAIIYQQSPNTDKEYVQNYQIG